MENLAMGFDECPYHCSNGTLFDRKLKKRIPCPYCSEKKRDMVNNGEGLSEEGQLMQLSEILGVRNEYMKPVFDYSLIIPDGERLFMDKDSLEWQSEVANELYLSVSVGQIPEQSYCFGLGNKGRIDRFTYPILVKAYLGGLSVSKFISCTDYNRMLVNMSNELDSFYNSDFVMMLICDGSSKADIAAAKGLMQSRALRGKPTVFVTTWSIEACSILLGYRDDPSYFLAMGVFVEYLVSGKNKHSKYINQLTGVENAPALEDKKPESRGISLEELLK